MHCCLANLPKRKGLWGQIQSTKTCTCLPKWANFFEVQSEWMPALLGHLSISEVWGEVFKISVFPIYAFLGVNNLRYYRFHLMQCLKFDTHIVWQIWSMGWFFIWECGHWCWMPPLDRERINRVRGANWPDTGDNQDEDGNLMLMVMVSLMRWRWMMVRMMNLLPPTSTTHLLLSRSQAVNPPRFPNNIVRRRNRNCDQKRFGVFNNLSGKVCKQADESIFLCQYKKD